MKKHYIILTCLILLVPSLWSEDLQARVREVEGKVEVQRGGLWQPVSEGEILVAGDKISTGFNSKAVLVLGDTSVLVANALTRLTIAELMEKEGTVVTDLFLDVGNVRTQVNSSEGTANDFQIRNANSTASVRGTVLDVEILGDGNGVKVMAWDGMADVQNNRTGRTTRVGERKKKKDDASGSEEEEKDGQDEESSDEGPADPPEPPAAIESAPVLASGDGGMVSSADSAIQSTTVTVSTKPPSPADISTGGGGSASTDDSNTGSITETVIEETAPAPTTSRVNVTVQWPWD